MRWIFRDVNTRKDILEKKSKNIEEIIHKMLELSRKTKGEIELYCYYKQKLIKMSSSSMYWS